MPNYPTTLRSTFLSTLFLALGPGLLIRPANAQHGPPVTPGKIGFSVQGQQGAAGHLCSGFQCAPLALGLTRGEILSFAIRSQPQSPFLLLVGQNPLVGCQTIPGIVNQWAGPGFVVLGGSITGQDTIRCWGGLQSIQVPVPQTLPLLTSAVFQVIADVQVSSTGTQKAPAFSAPVQLTVSR